MAKKLSGSSRPEALRSMSSEAIKSRRWTEKERQAIRRVAARQAQGGTFITKASGIPPLTKAQLAEMVRLREFRRKIPVSVRLDANVVEWLKAKGPGHLTRINDILLNLMEAEAHPRR